MHFVEGLFLFTRKFKNVNNLEGATLAHVGRSRAFRGRFSEAALRFEGAKNEDGGFTPKRVA